MTIEIAAKDYALLKEEVWNLFYNSIQTNNKRKSLSEKDFLKKIPSFKDLKVAEFIFDLVNDFTESFYEELVFSKKPEAITDAITLLVYQQIIITWISQLVEQTITPLLLFSIKNSGKIEEVKQIIARVFLAIAQDQVDSVEAENQVSTVLRNNYDLSDNLVVFIKSLIKTFASFKEKHGFDELAKIGEESIKGMKTRLTGKPHLFSKPISDSLYDRERIVNEWVKNILIPSCIVLRIAGEELHNNFVAKCKKNFDLFLDQTLTAEDFEKRLNIDLKKFGGEEEELIMPIQESIASSIRFLEIARIDDPSLSLLVLIMDEEQDNARKSYS
ncbi:MAG: hypothetical protein KGD59_14160 [Candidatus Heimdallarchaeota archaeon]|nr:hypothetical protein [Candidatus Heimdallarchaeota archaeon]MBY8995691.1 hypothetical protein [Candidatus Heimdallarchaeota archaeon]